MFVDQHGAHYWRVGIGDLVPLVQFRVARLHGRSRGAVRSGLATLVLITLLAAWLPAYLPGAVESSRAADLARLLPVAFLGVLVVSLVSAAAAGGGRELIAREQAVAFPVNPVTDHLGALLMTPLNVAWLMQAWLMLGMTAYVVGPVLVLALSQVLVVLWLCAGTALAQVLAWAVEWLRRGRSGPWAVTALVGGVAALAMLLIGTGSASPLLAARPTRLVVDAVVGIGRGEWWLWATVGMALVVIAASAVVAGALVAEQVARRPARAEQRQETSVRTVRPNPTSDFVALVRTDRVGIWRSVPLRRGLVVLVMIPCLVAVAGDLQWEMLTILPGLVASGGTLLFGVNAWCLDGRGALWRDSLPLSPAMSFGSRAVALFEVLGLTTAATVAFAFVSAGLPTASQLVALLCVTVVVCVQVVALSLGWSVRRPYPVDMRSARATPAPPLVMVGYSTRLALSTTFVALLFTFTAGSGRWQWSVLLAVPLLLLSAYKLARTSREWATPETRARVVSMVAR